MDYKKIFENKFKNENIIKKLCPKATKQSGIYIFYRQENGFKYAYVGQATKSLLSRLAQHLNGVQSYIDKSIKKHGLYSQTNPYGYKIAILEYCESYLCNEREQYYIQFYANKGYQMRNITGGSQGEGKFDINERKPAKTYRDGLKQGYENARKEIQKLFEKNLVYEINGKANKNKEKSFEKFKIFLKNGEK